MTPELERLRPRLKLPTLPAVATRLLELARDPDVTLDELARTIANDPAIAAKILSSANSPWYIRSRPSSTVLQALQVLGLNAAMTQVLSFSLLKSLRSTKPFGLDYELFWRRSVLAALAARNLGIATRAREIEELFLAALIQDIGLLALVQVDPTLYAAGETLQHDHAELSRREHTRFGHDHAEIGAWLMREWRLPAQVVDAVCLSHERPAPVDRELTFARRVALSGWIADAFIWPEEPQRLAALDPWAPLVDQRTLTGVVDQMLEQIKPTEQLFELRLMENQGDLLVRQARQLIADRQRAQLQPGTTHPPR